MTDKQIFENEIKCITRRNECVCNGGTDCVKCDLLMGSEEILKCYNRALKNIDLIEYYKSEIERLEDKLEEKSTEIKTLIPTIDRLMKINKAEVIEHLKKIDFNAFPKEVLSAIKTEAYKEIAEELKEIVNLDLCEAIDCSDYLYDLPKLIDNLVQKKIDNRD